MPQPDPAQAPAAAKPKPRRTWVSVVAALVAMSFVAGVVVLGAGSIAAWVWGKSRTACAVTPMVDRSLSASASSQQVTASGVSVTIPGGLLKTKTTLSIGTASGIPELRSRALSAGPAYEITLGDLKEFDQEILIRLGYDPSALAGEPEQSALAGYWDDGQKTWQLVSTAVDPAQNAALIRTRHLTVWRLFYVARGYAIRESAHFITVHDPSVSPIVGKLQIDSASFAQRVSSYLEEGYRKYAAAGFKLPSDKIWVFIDVQAFESQRGTLSGWI